MAVDKTINGSIVVKNEAGEQVKVNPSTIASQVKLDNGKNAQEAIDELKDTVDSTGGVILVDSEDDIPDDLPNGSLAIVKDPEATPAP